MDAQKSKMGSFYRFHAHIYNLTRWTFLFGRVSVLRKLGIDASKSGHVLEIGCGTGQNLAWLANYYPKLQMTGVDVSSSMLRVAKRNLKRHENRVQLVEFTYGQGSLPSTLTGLSPNFVLISYCLTMVNPGWEAVIDQVFAQMPQGATIAVVDFHDTRWPWFRRWMGFNHVRMEAHLLPYLEARFQPVTTEVKAAYGGCWRYVLFAGKK